MKTEENEWDENVEADIERTNWGSYERRNSVGSHWSKDCIDA